MAPAIYPLNLYRGDTYTLQVTFRDRSEDGTPGDPLDKTGSTFAAQIRRPADAADPAAEFDIDASDADTGIIVATLDADLVTEDLDGAIWDLQETTGDQVATKLRGPVTCRRDSTRP